MFPDEFSGMNYFERTRDAMKAPHADSALAAVAEDMTQAISNTGRLTSAEKPKFIENVALLGEIAGHLAKKGASPEVTAKAAYQAFINLNEGNTLAQAGRALEAWKQAVDTLPDDKKAEHVLEVAAAQEISPVDTSPLGIAVNEKMRSLPDSPHLREVASKLLLMQEANDGLLEVLRRQKSSEPADVADSAIEKARVLSKLRAEKPQFPELSRQATRFIESFQKWSGVHGRGLP